MFPAQYKVCLLGVTHVNSYVNINWLSPVEMLH